MLPVLKKQLCLIFLMFLAISQVFAEDALDYGAIEQAFSHADTDYLQTQFTYWQDQSHKNTHEDYFTAYVGYRYSAALIQNHMAKAARQPLKHSIALLRRLLKDKKTDSEAAALLSGLYGLSILASPYKAIYLGPRATRWLEKSLDWQPNNPRGLLMKGVAEFQTPTIFGGSKVQAKEALELGLSHFMETDEISWGQVDLHLWLGRLYGAEGDVEKSQAHYEKALQLMPNNMWVIRAINGEGYQLETHKENREG